MKKDQTIGAVILIGSVVGVLVYGWLVYAFPIVVLQITAFLAVAAVFTILAWIGWTLATTPPPTPFESETMQASDSSIDDKRLEKSGSAASAEGLLR